ncbi:MAG: DNA polymerase III subunit delta [Candidatus Saccharimonadaceae bacterium]
MISWFVGENTFEVREAVRAIEVAFSGTPERIDGSELTLARLPDLLMGMSLFATERLVMISGISQNSTLWEKLPDWLSRISDDIHIVFIDTKPDKRTTSYKALKAASELREFPVWLERDTQKADQWVEARAKTLGVKMDRRGTQHLVTRVGLDQWQLAQALDTLSLLDTVTVEAIDTIVPPNLHENIFQLFETALEGKPAEVAAKLSTLALQEDPYALFALLSSQALTLAAVTYASDDTNPAKDFAIHPFVASKMVRHGTRLGKHKVGVIVEAFAKTDADMKRSKAEPWLLIERVLLEVSKK